MCQYVRLATHAQPTRPTHTSHHNCQRAHAHTHTHTLYDLYLDDMFSEQATGVAGQVEIKRRLQRDNPHCLFLSRLDCQGQAKLWDIVAVASQALQVLLLMLNTAKRSGMAVAPSQNTDEQALYHARRRYPVEPDADECYVRSRKQKDGT